MKELRPRGEQKPETAKEDLHKGQIERPMTSGYKLSQDLRHQKGPTSPLPEVMGGVCIPLHIINSICKLLTQMCSAVMRSQPLLIYLETNC